MDGNRVVVTGMGVVSPVGVGCTSFWNALMSGVSGIGPVTHWDASRFASQIAGEVKDLDTDVVGDPKLVRQLDRHSLFGVVATVEAMRQAGIEQEVPHPDRSGVIIGSGIGGLSTLSDQFKVLYERGPRRVSPFLIPKMIANIAGAHTAIQYNLRGPNFAVVTACASGSHAIGESFRYIRDGIADFMVAGGAEATITEIGYAGFCSMKALSTRNDDPDHASRPFDKQRDGFIMGEGAGILVLESLEHAKARNATIYGELLGYGLSCDAHHITAPDPTGAGAANSMRAALRSAGIEPDAVDYVNAHGTSTQLNDKVESLAITHVFGQHAKKLAVSSTKSMTGHLLGAAGGVEAVACLHAIEHGMLPPTINYEEPDPDCADLDYVPNEARSASINVALSNSMGFGGHNASVLLSRFSE